MGARYNPRRRLVDGVFKRIENNEFTTPVDELEIDPENQYTDPESAHIFHRLFENEFGREYVAEEYAELDGDGFTGDELIEAWDYVTSPKFGPDNELGSALEGESHSTTKLY